MSAPTECPKCKADLRQKPPPHYRGRGDLSRVIGIYDRDRDRTTHWKCPDCGAEWERK